MRRGILGGTFDPPHLAHLLAGEVAYRQLGLEEVTFLPAGSPWQKADRRVTAPHHRVEMIRRAVKGVSYFTVDPRETARPGWTYTIDTLAEFDPSEELVLILGADAARGLPSWHRVEAVVARAEVAVAPRPGIEPSSVRAPLDRDLIWLDMPLLEVSGTAIRARARQGKGFRFLVPDPVWDYATEQRLYE